MKLTRKLFIHLALPLLASTAAGYSQAADSSPAVKRVNIAYTISRDLRLCAAPQCGGWYVTPVNVLTMGLTSESEVLAAQASVLPASTYVADLQFGCTQWNNDEIEGFKHASDIGTTLVFGQVLERNWGVDTHGQKQTLNSFLVRDAYTAATKNPPLGTYLAVQNSGIVCVTTPCPYYSGDVLNSNLAYDFFDVNFTKAGLSADDQRAANANLAVNSLLVTGVTEPFQGRAGAGVGLAVTQVFWPYPARKH